MIFFRQKENLENKEISPIADFLQSIVVAVSICIVVYLFIATPNQIDGQSMEPNFSNGEIILTNKITHWFGGTQIGKSLGMDYGRGDVVVFQKPGFNDFIKRIIAIPGDTIAINDGSVYINNIKLKEEYLGENTYTRGGTFVKENTEPVVVPEGNYFVMGDNRSNSHDSRYIDIGFINRDWLKGKVILRYWPIYKLSLI